MLLTCNLVAIWKWKVVGGRGTSTIITKRWPLSRMFTLMEEHPLYNLKNGEGNFNVIDRVSTRHSLAIGSLTNSGSKGRSNIAFLDGHRRVGAHPRLARALDRFQFEVSWLRGTERVKRATRCTAYSAGASERATQHRGQITRKWKRSRELIR